MTTEIGDIVAEAVVGAVVIAVVIEVIIIIPTTTTTLIADEAIFAEMIRFVEGHTAEVSAD